MNQFAHRRDVPPFHPLLHPLGKACLCVGSQGKGQSSIACRVCDHVEVLDEVAERGAGGGEGGEGLLPFRRLQVAAATL